MTENGKKLTRIHTVFVAAILFLVTTTLASAESLCAQCQDELDTVWYEQGGGKYHQECLSEAVEPRCLVCGKVLNRTHYFDGLAGHVCINHLSQVERCCSCQRFIAISDDRGAVKLEDGRSLCAVCAQTSITDLSVVEWLTKEVRAQLAGYGIRLRSDIPIQLANREELLKHAGHRERHPLGATVYRSDLTRSGKYLNRDFRILLLNSLPEAHLKEVIAHELMHVWLLTNGVDQLDRASIEGACQYAAYLVLGEDSSEQGRFYCEQLVSNDDHIYGNGFREVAEIVEEVGLSGWLSSLRENSEVPIRSAAD